MHEEMLSRRWTDQALLILSPALDAHIEQVIADVIGHDVPWTYVLQELDKMRGKAPQKLSRRDPAVQLRMITERLGELGYPFDSQNRNRLFSTYGQMLRLARNQLSHPDDQIEPIHAMTTITTATQLASLIDAPETVKQLNDLQGEVLEYLWSEHDDDDEVQEAQHAPISEPLQQPTPSVVQESAPEQPLTEAPHDTAVAKGSLAKRIVEWEPISISPIGEKDDLDNLRQKSSRRKVVQAIETVVDNFGPVSEGQLLSSVARAFGLKRRTTPFRNKIKRQIQNGNAAVWRDQDGFYWPKGVDPVKWRIYRKDPHGRRQLQNISPHELVNLLELIVEEEPGQHSKRGLFTRVRDEFGLKRLRGPAREHVNKAIHRGMDHGAFAVNREGKFVPASTPAGN